MTDSAPDKLILFTRFPESGKTKTRLIPLLGEKGASDLHRELVAHALSTIRHMNGVRNLTVEIHYDGGDEESMRALCGNGAAYRPQRGGNLGERMKHSFDNAFKSGSKRVVIIGSDCPGLTSRTLHNAFENLSKDDLVLGPAHDGGYYLIGLSSEANKKKPGRIFEAIPWGSDTVLEDTLSAADNIPLTRRLLETLHDIDRPEDVRIWKKLKKMISVVIPALNEASNIRNTLKALETGKNIEIILVDGGSDDETAAIAESLGVRVMKSKRGRANQLNAGAETARGDYLLFLHADTIVSDGFDDAIREVLSDEKIACGAFTFKIGDIGLGLRIIEAIANLRSRFLHMPYGDQALFMKRSVFYDIGAFPSMPIMEDFELVRRLKRTGRIRTSDIAVTTSGRRWKNVGLVKTTIMNQLIVTAYFLGVSPVRLRGWYNKKN